jgi:REP element-mobilizing transposase RayT
MSQLLACLLVHIVFRAKHRAPGLAAPHRPDLHVYLATVARDIACECLRADGVADRVHLALRLARAMAAAELMRTVKAMSSVWMKALVPGFSRQYGCGALSVSQSERSALLRYIAGGA